MKNVRWLSLVLALILTACASSPPKPSLENEPFLKFPDGFLWGTATAAYQVEGGISNNWSAAGIDAKQAVNHYDLYEQDFDQAQKLGSNAYRMSIEWARIEPEQGKFDREAIDHYRQMLKALHRRGIEPMVTLFHFTTPIWFDRKGGFSKSENITHFIDFVRFVSREFKDDVSWWNTVNEPLVYAFKSFDEGTWPPFRHDRNEALRVVRNLILAHGKAYRTIHRQDPIAWVGYAHNNTLLQPNWPANPMDQAMTSLQSYLFNESFWNAIVTGQMDFSAPGLDPVKIAYDPDLKGSMDYIGINYYTRYMVDATGKTLTLPGVPVSDLNWEIYPEGLLYVLRMARPHAEALNIPIIITENGLADSNDTQRSKYLVDHLAYLHQALQEGIPVKGYFHWSLMDNFEWAEGFHAQFGLMNSDRQWRKSAYLYQQIAQQNGFPSRWLKQSPEIQIPESEETSDSKESQSLSKETSL